MRIDGDDRASGLPKRSRASRTSRKMPQIGAKPIVLAAPVDADAGGTVVAAWGAFETGEVLMAVVVVKAYGDAL